MNYFSQIQALQRISNWLVENTELVNGKVDKITGAKNKYWHTYTTQNMILSNLLIFILKIMLLQISNWVFENKELGTGN